ncbi:protein FAR1-RELATED SEQUENCE 5-like [Henckelia pumila]|uniref:protein FAR1-RELATED SEQUENCE 5-like n=1 Tax=Henckelia pumila TaxID=405737 RepID=UPI003C6DC5E8
MYDLRKKWVPAYLNHVFAAGMSSSQRSESSHSFFKRYVSKKNSLVDFIIRFNRALKHQRHNELVSDHVDRNESPKIKGNLPMEHQMVKVYTKKKWVEFESEISESHGYCVQQVSEEDEKVIYNVMHYQSSSSSKPKVLTHDKEKNYISCSCKKFDFEGIPCRHMLAYFRFNQVFQLPDKYILNRWTQHAMVGAPYTMGEENISNDPEKLLISRHSRLSFKSSLIVDEASLTDERTKLMEEQLDSLYYKIREINSSRNLSMGRQRKRTIDGPLDILDPFEVRTKRCGKRLKSAKEKSISRVRQCHGCGLRGVSHDKRNCPNLRDGSTIDNQYNSDTSTDEEDVDP